MCWWECASQSFVCACVCMSLPTSCVSDLYSGPCSLPVGNDVPWVQHSTAASSSLSYSILLMTSWSHTGPFHAKSPLPHHHHQNFFYLEHSLSLLFDIHSHCTMTLHHGPDIFSYRRSFMLHDSIHRKHSLFRVCIPCCDKLLAPLQICSAFFVVRFFVTQMSQIIKQVVKHGFVQSRAFKKYINLIY